MTRSSAAFVLAFLVGAAPAVHAQTESAPEQARTEETEPRIVGSAGMLRVGVSGYLDRFFSSEETFATNYTVQADASWFMTRRFVVRGGMAGTGRYGGDESATVDTGVGAPALHAFGGLLYYFTPQSMVSFYSGAEYWAQLTRRANRDAGSVLGVLGLEAAMSSRVNVFMEGGYGVELTAGDAGERRWRLIGRVGIRLK